MFHPNFRCFLAYLRRQNVFSGAKQAFSVPIFKFSFSRRYDSEGTYLDSLPELFEERYGHACTTFTSVKGVQVPHKKL